LLLHGGGDDSPVADFVSHWKQRLINETTIAKARGVP